MPFSSPPLPFCPGVARSERRASGQPVGALQSSGAATASLATAKEPPRSPVQRGVPAPGREGRGWALPGAPIWARTACRAARAGTPLLRFASEEGREAGGRRPLAGPPRRRRGEARRGGGRVFPRLGLRTGPRCSGRPGRRRLMAPVRFLSSWLRPLRRKMVNINDLPPDILEGVLSLVPGKELVCSCRLVCSQWRDVVDMPALWKRKCQQEGYFLAMSDRSIPDWKTTYFLCSLKRNLIKNPCGEKGLKFWEFKSKKKKVWKIEKAPEADVYFPHIRKCFVAYHLCTFKHQLVTLKNEGYWDELMDETKPDIVVKDWYYFSPNYRYELCIKLLSADFSVLQECRPEEFFRHQGRDEDKWCEVSYTFHNYPAGVRHIRFIHGNEGWTYMRVTNSSVTVGPEVAQQREPPGTDSPVQRCDRQMKPCSVF